MPRCLMYEIYVETCGQSAQNQVNPATFGKVSTETSQSCVHSDVLFCKLQPPGGAFKCEVTFREVSGYVMIQTG